MFESIVLAKVRNLAVLVSLLCAAMVVYDVNAQETDSSGWYLIKNCSTSFYDASTNMIYWAKGSASGTKGESSTKLIADEDYYVIGGRRFTAYGTDYAFPGASLTMGDDSNYGELYLRGKPQTYKNLILNRGYVVHAIYRSNPNVINYYDNLFGSATVRGTKESPIIFYSDYHNLWMGWGGELKGNENASLHIGTPTHSKTNILVSVTNAAAYYGEIVVTSKYVNTGRVFGYGLGVSGSIPATVRIKGGSIIKAHAPTSVADIKALHMDEDTGMWFICDSTTLRSGVIRVSEALTLPEKVMVHALTGCSDGKWLPPISTTGEEVRNPFFVGPPGVRINPDVFEFVPDPAYEPSNASDIRPQRVHFEVETDTVSNRDTVYAVIEPIVVMIKKQNDVREKDKALAQGTALTNATFWSDGRVPHSKAHYVINYRLLSPIEDDTEYVFPGKSMLFYAGGFGVFGRRHRLKIPDFRTANIIEQGQSASVTICGGKFHACGDRVSLRAYAGNTLAIESEMVGSANLSLLGEDGTSSPHGYFAFKSFNTNWYGTIDVTAPENGSVDDWSKDILTVRLYDGRNLGGTLGALDYKALALGRYCELYVHNNATLDAAANRGIFLKHEKGAKIAVTNNATLECNWPITFNGPLYKSMPGTLALGGGVKFYDGEDAVDTLPEDPAKRLLVVTNGTLKALTHDCVNGLTIALAKDSPTALELDFATEQSNLARYGFYNVKTDTPFSADAPINIVLKNIDGAMLKEMKEYKQGLVTVKTAAANALGLDGLIKFSKSYKSGDSRMTLVREDDVATGLTTYSACYKFVGSQVVVR